MAPPTTTTSPTDAPSPAGAVKGNDIKKAGGVAVHPRTGAVVQKEGWLNKQGNFIRNWRPRWVQLVDGILYYFKEPAHVPATKPTVGTSTARMNSVCRVDGDDKESLPSVPVPELGESVSVRVPSGTVEPDDEGNDEGDQGDEDDEEAEDGGAGPDPADDEDDEDDHAELLPPLDLDEDAPAAEAGVALVPAVDAAGALPPRAALSPPLLTTGTLGTLFPPPPPPVPGPVPTLAPGFVAANTPISGVGDAPTCGSGDPPAGVGDSVAAGGELDGGCGNPIRTIP
ncbi:hypothetical protein AMAG_19515 [Allomyces macrogynus ATCC 38327]|uniref:PH domain-containing protein n=1 Tax=Allomyces macrogynus (strain ATCC 38327) TaxID=578462 RepID=A0A0L0SWE1_ALLM3|nr:hypothetical protein AMAG_19515 [Allomyces macrogynus ATCC 38327]|eukprot:KNE66791.1 hypothetical protein AMAG_19515 [Allomyces macrogynus ATCC 38327]